MLLVLPLTDNCNLTISAFSAAKRLGVSTVIVRCLQVGISFFLYCIVTFGWPGFHSEPFCLNRMTSRGS